MGSILPPRMYARTENDDVKAWAKMEMRVREAVQTQKLTFGLTEDVEEVTRRVMLVVRCANVAHRAVTPMFMLRGSTDKLLEHYGLQVRLLVSIKFVTSCMHEWNDIASAACLSKWCSACNRTPHPSMHTAD